MSALLSHRSYSVLQFSFSKDVNDKNLANPLEVAFLATAGECVDVKMSVHLKRCWVSTARAVHVGLSETMLHTIF